MTIRGTLLGIGAIFWLSAIACWIRAPRERRLSREAVLFLLLGMPFLASGLFFTGSNYPQETPAAAPLTPPAVSIAQPPAGAPAPSPEPLPPPDLKSFEETVNAAQYAAVARYPELGKAGSSFNSRFVAVYRRRRAENPEYFDNPQWPLQLADEIARAGAVPD